MDGGASLRITDDPADDYDPAFSPEGTQLAFRSERAGGGIYLSSVLGGEARLLIPNGRRPRFSPDGQRLLYWTGPPDTQESSLDAKFWQRSTSGGDPVQIGRGCRIFENSAVWSPDGSRILFIGTCGSDLQHPDPQTHEVRAWVADADGRNMKSNDALYAVWPSLHIGNKVINQWLANPSRLLLPIPAGDASSVMTVPISNDGTRITGPPQRLTFSGGRVTGISAAAGGRIALTSEIQESHIWAMSMRADGVALGSPKELTHGPAGEYSPALSANGEKLAFLSQRSNGIRLFYKDLITAREKEISTDGYRYGAPSLNIDGTKVMCVQYPRADSWRDFIFEVPISGGISRKIWDKELWMWLNAWSPDESTILYSSSGTTYALDLRSVENSPFLQEDQDVLADERFSHDGRWVVFTAAYGVKEVAEPPDSELFIAPFRNSNVPRREWIPVIGRNMGYSHAPNFSHDDTRIYFLSKRDGHYCVWTQKLTHAMQPEGPPVAVYHSHEVRHNLFYRSGLAIGPNSIVFEQRDLSGNIWLLEPAKAAGH